MDHPPKKDVRGDSPMKRPQPITTKNPSQISVMEPETALMKTAPGGEFPKKEVWLPDTQNIKSWQEKNKFDIWFSDRSFETPNPGATKKVPGYIFGFRWIDILERQTNPNPLKFCELGLFETNGVFYQYEYPEKNMRSIVTPAHMQVPWYPPHKSSEINYTKLANTAGKILGLSKPKFDLVLIRFCQNNFWTVLAELLETIVGLPGFMPERWEIWNHMAIIDDPSYVEWIFADAPNDFPYLRFALEKAPGLYLALRRLCTYFQFNFYPSTGFDVIRKHIWVHLVNKIGLQEAKNLYREIMLCAERGSVLMCADWHIEYHQYKDWFEANCLEFSQMLMKEMSITDNKPDIEPPKSALLKGGMGAPMEEKLEKEMRYQKARYDEEKVNFTNRAIANMDATARSKRNENLARRRGQARLGVSYVENHFLVEGDDPEFVDREEVKVDPQGRQVPAPNQEPINLGTYTLPQFQAQPEPIEQIGQTPLPDLDPQDLNLTPAVQQELAEAGFTSHDVVQSIRAQKAEDLKKEDQRFAPVERFRNILHRQQITRNPNFNPRDIEEVNANKSDENRDNGFFARLRSNTHEALTFHGWGDLTQISRSQQTGEALLPMLPLIAVDTVDYWAKYAKRYKDVAKDQKLPTRTAIDGVIYGNEIEAWQKPFLTIGDVQKELWQQTFEQVLFMHMGSQLTQGTMLPCLMPHQVESMLVFDTYQTLSIFQLLWAGLWYAPIKHVASYQIPHNNADSYITAASNWHIFGSWSHIMSWGNSANLDRSLHFLLHTKLLRLWKACYGYKLNEPFKYYIVDYGTPPVDKDFFPWFVPISGNQIITEQMDIFLFNARTLFHATARIPTTDEDAIEFYTTMVSLYVTTWVTYFHGFPEQIHAIHTAALSHPFPRSKMYLWSYLVQSKWAENQEWIGLITEILDFVTVNTFIQTFYNFGRVHVEQHPYTPCKMLRDATFDIRHEFNQNPKTNMINFQLDVFCYQLGASYVKCFNCPGIASNIVLKKGIFYATKQWNPANFEKVIKYISIEERDLQCFNLPIGQLTERNVIGIVQEPSLETIPFEFNANEFDRLIEEYVRENP